jgi:hypothetical protein
VKRSSVTLQHLRMQLDHFRRGQQDRKNDLPCMETNGRYLEGWYAPNVDVPDFLTVDLMEQMKELEP